MSHESIETRRLMRSWIEHELRKAKINFWRALVSRAEGRSSCARTRPTGRRRTALLSDFSLAAIQRAGAGDFSRAQLQIPFVLVTGPVRETAVRCIEAMIVEVQWYCPNCWMSDEGTVMRSSGGLMQRTCDVTF